MTNTELLQIALKKIGLDSIPFELLELGITEPDKMNDVIAGIMMGKIRTYNTLVGFLKSGKITAGETQKTVVGDDIPEKMKKLSDELKTYFGNMAEKMADRVSATNKAFQRKKAIENAKRKINDSINNIFSEINPDKEKNVETIFDKMSRGMNDVFGEIKKNFEDTGAGNTDGVFSDFSQKINSTIEQVDHSVDENNNGTSSERLTKILDDISENVSKGIADFRSTYTKESPESAEEKRREFSEKADEIGKNIGEAFESVLGGIGTVAGSILGGIGGLIENSQIKDMFEGYQPKSTVQQRTPAHNPLDDEKDDIIDVEEDEIEPEKTVEPMNEPVKEEIKPTAEEPEEIEPNPDTQMTSLEGDYLITGAAQKGNRHKYCDDWFEIAETGSTLIMAVADGRGCGKFSGLSAKSACQNAVEYIEEKILTLQNNSDFMTDLRRPTDDVKFKTACSALSGIIQESVICAKNRIVKELEEKQSIYENVTLEDFATTLTVTIAIPLEINDSKETFIINCQVGDAITALINETKPFSSSLKLLCNDNVGKKEFLTSDIIKSKSDLMPKTKIARRKVTKIFLMTNGLSELYVPYMPKLSELALDLKLNGIISLDDDSEMILDDIEKEPSENGFSYSADIMKRDNITLNELWRKRSCIEDTSDNQISAEKLLKWLAGSNNSDNSDDKTLVIAEIK